MQIPSLEQFASASVVLSMQGFRVALDLGHLQIFVFLYTILKQCINGHQNVLLNGILVIIKILLTLVVALPVFLLILLFAIYSEIVNVILKWRLGDKYYGLMEGSDVVWALEDKTNCVINSLFMLEVPANETFEDVHRFFVDKYYRLAQTHLKIACVRKQFMGYYYYKRIDVNIASFVKYLNDYDNLDDFKTVLDQCSNRPLPENNEALWEVLVGKSAIKWDRDGSLLFPVIIRFHHCFGDGVSIIAMNTTNLLQNGVDIMRSKCETYEAVLQKNRSKKKRKTFSEKICETLSREFYLKYSGPFFPGELNKLHGKNLSGQKHNCWVLEPENGGYVEKVKRIKAKFPGLSFSDVLVTAISASLADYFMSNDQNPPVTLRAAMTYFFSSTDFNKIIRIVDGQPIARLQNQFSVGTVDLPIKDEDVVKNIGRRLAAVQKDVEKLKSAVDLGFLYWQLKVSTIVPSPLVFASTKTNDNTLIITNVPGNTTATLLNGHVIRDTVIWAPNFSKMGITFTIFSYDNLFRLGLVADKAIIEERCEVQKIVNKVLDYIDLINNFTSVD